jgi:hypothetical protein
MFFLWLYLALCLLIHFCLAPCSEPGFIAKIVALVGNAVDLGGQTIAVLVKPLFGEVSPYHGFHGYMFSNIVTYGLGALIIWWLIPKRSKEEGVGFRRISDEEVDVFDLIAQEEAEEAAEQEASLAKSKIIKETEKDKRRKNTGNTKEINEDDEEDET